ncbi:MAG: multidrug resistance efflux pump [Saprospiraceae bacterium]|jgi:multidrug resistance efflux pump
MPELISKPEHILINEQQEIQQIMGDPPSWIVRWGISLVLISVTVLFMISYLVKYPDIITAPITLETANPPIRVPARMTGKIEQLRVIEGETVETGQVLAILENTADLVSVDQLEILISEVNETGIYDDLDLPRNLSLGVLQDSWSNFSESHKDHTYFLRKDKTTTKTRLLRRQIRQNEELAEVIEGRKESLFQEEALIKVRLERSLKLLSEGLISAEDHEGVQTEAISIKRQILNIDAEFINNKIAIEQLKRAILDLDEAKDKTGNEKEVKIEENFQKLKNDVEAWKMNFLIKAPIDGKVSFSKPLSVNEFVSANDEIMTIVPIGEESSGEIKGFASLPFEGAGKVVIGQRVNIWLESFPAEQFGAVIGEVKNIALVPQQNSYLVEVALPNKLQTTYDKELPFSQQMAGNANIVTEERRYLERILDKVTSAWKNQ